MVTRAAGAFHAWCKTALIIHHAALSGMGKLQATRATIRAGWPLKYGLLAGMAGDKCETGARHLFIFMIFLRLRRIA
jgi:hypothetical protein